MPSCLSLTRPSSRRRTESRPDSGDDAGQYDDARDVFWATGAALMLRRSALDEVGLLDERFVMHMEEIDLCWRLHRRGYREEAVSAPMQETVAAACIRWSGWDGERPLHDVMCGSGTLLTEALMHACRIPAGYLQEHFGFMQAPDFDADLTYQGVRAERAEADGTSTEVLWIAEPCVEDVLRKGGYEDYEVIEEVTAEYGYSKPKLGIIDDGNPNAFTYGSARFNARIVVTEGLFEFLEDDELASVVAHELGHGVHQRLARLAERAQQIGLLRLAEHPPAHHHRQLPMNR